MKITIRINTHSDAFLGKERAETARILQSLAKTLEYGNTLHNDTKLPCLDNNGKIVGYLTVKE